MQSLPVSEDLTDKGRLASIDVFRGLTIFIMIFVNDLAGVRNIPWWMEHAPADGDFMTFVDVVFPAFLFIVGMAIPLAINKRLEKGDSVPEIWKHILIRTAGLLVLGFYMVNIGGIDPALTGMTKYVWMLLLFLAAIMVWNRYPATDSSTRQWIYRGLRIVGVITLILLAVIYRRSTNDGIGWMRTQWWGILGLIGWAYIATVIVYMIFRKHLVAVVGSIVFFLALYVGEKSGSLDFLSGINHTVALGSQVGAHAAIATSGMILGMLFFSNSPADTAARRIRWILVYAVFLFVIGYLIRPVYGISKIYATPTWGLYSAGFCSVLYVFLYWLVDLKGIVKWAKFLSPAGKNPLLAYILPSIVFAILMILHITVLSDYLGSGIIGIIRSLVFALIMLWLTSLLSKLHIRLHL